MAVTASLRVNFDATQTGANDLGALTFQPKLNKLVSLASGVSAGQADVIWADTRTIAASSTDDMDLAGALTSAFGASIAMAKIVAVIVQAATTNTNDVVIGAGTNAVGLFGGTNGTVSVKPGGIFVLAAPAVAGQAGVTAGTADILRAANSGAGTSVEFSIIVVGRSA